jgi:hypothetical protein
MSSNDCLTCRQSERSGAIQRRIFDKGCLRSRAQGFNLTMPSRFHRQFAFGVAAQIVFALSIGATPTMAMAKHAVPERKPSRPSLWCSRSSERVVSGLTKICYFDCGKSERALKVTTYEACPNWALRWQLNRNAAYGPSLRSR